MITKEKIAELRELEKAATPDCGDNSCFFSRDLGGMRTNGGCRCYRDLRTLEQRHYPRKGKIALDSMPSLLDEIERLQAALEAIVDDPGFPIEGNEAVIALRMNLIAHKALGSDTKT